MRIPSVVAAGIRHVRVVRTGWTLDCWHWAVEKCKVSSGFKKWIPFSHLSQILYELEKKSSLVTRTLSAKSCTRDTDSLHSCTRLRLVQEMACLYHECKILPRKHSYPNLIPIISPFTVTAERSVINYAFHVWSIKTCLKITHAAPRELPKLTDTYIFVTKYRKNRLFQDNV